MVLVDSLRHHLPTLMLCVRLKSKIAFSIELGIFAVILGCLAWLAQRLRASHPSLANAHDASKQLQKHPSVVDEHESNDDNSQFNDGNFANKNKRNIVQSCRCIATQTEPEPVQEQTNDFPPQISNKNNSVDVHLKNKSSSLLINSNHNNNHYDDNNNINDVILSSNSEYSSSAYDNNNIHSAGIQIPQQQQFEQEHFSIKSFNNPTYQNINNNETVLRRRNSLVCNNNNNIYESHSKEDSDDHSEYFTVNNNNNYIQNTVQPFVNNNYSIKPDLLLSTDYETDSELSSIYSLPTTTTTTMAAIPQPPPPPPPMPGTSGSFMMPNWRDTYQSPFPERVPTKEEIEKQQYAHLPDKLLNTLNKERKPFTYTPSGVSSEKGVLDLSEIRSPRMKKRLLANLHAGEEEEEEQDQNQSQQTTPTDQQQKSSPNYNQYTASPLVLPPIADANRLRSPSPNYGQQPKKEVRFAPSPVPVLSCDDSELASKLAARKQDVEARATIVTNDPIGEDNVDGLQQEQRNDLSSLPSHSSNLDEMSQLCKNAADAVRTARGFVSDYNNNKQYESDNINQLSDHLNEQLRFNDQMKKQETINLNYRPQQQQFSENSQNNLTNNQYTNSTQLGYNTDVLKHVLDAGLQDEIDKFEEMGAKMGSTSPESGFRNFNEPVRPRPVNRPPPPPVPPKPNHMIYQGAQDGRTSCPPVPNYHRDTDFDFQNNFRCISPAIEILKKTQNSGYNYVSKPRPFYRAIDENCEVQQFDNSAFMPPSAHHHPMSSFKPANGPNNERVIPVRIEDRNGYSSSLPRKIKLNHQQDPTQPKSYENPELGREYLPQAGMFSQLPPKMNNNDSNSPGTPPFTNKMFYGVNSRQQQQQQPIFQSDNAKPYVDPEANRQYLPQAGMFSQLPPNSQPSYNSNDLYNFKSSNRQTSLPPQSMYNRSVTPTSSSGTPPSYGTQPRSKSRLSLSELRKLPPSERPHEPAPSKYLGAHIPSRSFRILQLITGEDVPNKFAEEERELEEDRQMQSVRRSQPPPTPPRNDSYRPASQQTFRTNINYEQNSFESSADNNNFNQASNQQQQQEPPSSSSSVYASSAFGTDF